jgi:branched-chain amino acid transport system permease protein
VGWLRYRVFVESAVLAALAGGLFAAHKGAVFPSSASVGTSVDALLVVLMGGVHWVWGALAGSVLLTAVQAELGRNFDYWRGALGLLVMLLMVLAPSGLGGLLRRKMSGKTYANTLQKTELLVPINKGLQAKKAPKL